MKKKKKITKAVLEKRDKRKARRDFKVMLEQWKKDVIKRDDNKCQYCGKDLSKQRKHAHHILALQYIKRHAPVLLNDINNGILLCAYDHKFAPTSPHQNSFFFTYWLKMNKPEQFEYLANKIDEVIDDNN